MPVRRCHDDVACAGRAAPGGFEEFDNVVSETVIALIALPSGCDT